MLCGVYKIWFVLFAKGRRPLILVWNENTLAVSDSQTVAPVQPPEVFPCSLPQFD